MPLCAIHHHQIHATGKEREWWEERNMDPLVVASRLWQESRKHRAAIPASPEIGFGSSEASEPNDKLGGAEVASGPAVNANRRP